MPWYPRYLATYPTDEDHSQEQRCPCLLTMPGHCLGYLHATAIRLTYLKLVVANPRYGLFITAVRYEAILEHLPRTSATKDV